MKEMCGVVSYIFLGLPHIKQVFHSGKFIYDEFLTVILAFK